MVKQKRYTKEQLEEIVHQSYSIREVLYKVGLAFCEVSRTKVKKDIYNFNIDHSHFVRQRACTNKPIQDILVENSTFGRCALKKRLLKDNLIENKCNICSQNETWNGKPLIMILDHVNGINNDNRIENLRMLCPNCNSQQDTFAGKNKEKKLYYCKDCGNTSRRKRKSELCWECFLKQQVNLSKQKHSICQCGNIMGNRSTVCKRCYHIQERKVSRPSKEELFLLMITRSIVAIGRKYGVSDNAVRKWINKYNSDKHLKN